MNVFLYAIAYGLSYNPLTSLAGSVVGAGLLTAGRRSQLRAVWGWSVLVIAWLLGDGLRIMGVLRDGLDGGGPLSQIDGSGGRWALVGVWAVVSMLVGYLAPATTGSAVGARVTFGTGWLSGMVVAGTVAAAVYALASTVVGAIPLT